MKDKDKLKEKASKLIDKFAKNLTKTTHSVIDKTGELSKQLEVTLKDGFETFMEGVDMMTDYINEKEVSSLVKGDIVVSRTDIKKKDGTVFYHAGEVFEFSEEVIQYLNKTPLYTPDIKSAVRFGRIDELRRFDKKIVPDGNPMVLKDYVKTRLTEISTSEAKKEEPVNV